VCGIAGELRFDNARPDLAALGRMAGALQRRGPDHEGAWIDRNLALVQRRLAVIDLSPASQQPMIDAELGLALVFNGTIYNYRELRRELSSFGYHFFSQGDTEVIIKAYHRWGSECVTRLDGVFAVAIWEMHRKILFLARDRLGIKPLYWTTGRNYLRFASSTQALLAAGAVDTAIDPMALHHLFTLHAVVPAPRTILSGIKKLAPAHTLTIGSDGTQREQRYWNLTAERPRHPRSEEELIAATRAALLAALHRRMTIADVPVGVLLSGGLDSSLLVGLLADFASLRTFSIGFDDQPEEKGSEFEYSDCIAGHFHTQHRRITISNSEVVARLPEAFAQMSEPMFAQDAVAFYLLSEQVSREIKVVVSGQGADEVFAGYFWYPQMAAAIHLSPWERFRNFYCDRDHEEFLLAISADFHGADYTADYIQGRLSEPGAATFIDQVLRLDIATLIVDDPVKRVDNMTMAWGVEARVPFLDQHLVELAATIPPELKLAGGGKYILKQIATGLLPDKIINRPKGYFPLPALKYIRGESLRLVREIVNSPACRARGIYHRPYVEKLLAAPEAYLTRIHGNKLWHLAALELWLQINVDHI